MAAARCSEPPQWRCVARAKFRISGRCAGTALEDVRRHPWRRGHPEPPLDEKIRQGAHREAAQLAGRPIARVVAPSAPTGGVAARTCTQRPSSAVPSQLQRRSNTALPPLRTSECALRETRDFLASRVCWPRGRPGSGQRSLTRQGLAGMSDSEKTVAFRVAVRSRTRRRRRALRRLGRGTIPGTMGRQRRARKPRFRIYLAFSSR